MISTTPKQTSLSSDKSLPLASEFEKTCDDTMNLELSSQNNNNSINNTIKSPATVKDFNFNELMIPKRPRYLSNETSAFTPIIVNGEKPSGLNYASTINSKDFIYKTRSEFEFVNNKNIRLDEKLIIVNKMKKKLNDFIQNFLKNGLEAGGKNASFIQKIKDELIFIEKQDEIMQHQAYNNNNDQIERSDVINMNNLNKMNKINSYINLNNMSNMNNEENIYIPTTNSALENECNDYI